MQHWTMSEAKNKFSELVDKTIAHGPQVVTKWGKEIVVVISAEEFDRLRTAETSLVDFFRNSPLLGVKLDLVREKTLPRDVE